MHVFAITFRPKPEMLKKGSEPLYLFRELRKLGDLVLTAQTDLVPSLASLEADHPYLWWTGSLKTSAARAQIDEIFEFVIDDCDLEIDEVFESDIAQDAQIVEAFAEPSPVEAEAPVSSAAPAPAELAAPSLPSEGAEPATAPAASQTQRMPVGLRLPSPLRPRRESSSTE